MIPMAIFAPLVIGGLASALWREYRQKQRASVFLSPPEALSPTLQLTDQRSTAQIISEKIMPDDSTEISHYQRTSLIAFALSGSGALFYAPITLVSIPLLSYNAFYFLKTIRRSNIEKQTSALTIFEVACLAGTLISGRYFMAATLLGFSFTARKWMLQAGNLAHVGINQALDPQFNKVWVLRGDAEVETTLADVQADDIAVLHTGDIIRMNGVIVDGEGVIEQYTLSGVMQAVPKKSGHRVFAFTKVVAGDLHVKYAATQ